MEETDLVIEIISWIPLEHIYLFIFIALFLTGLGAPWPEDIILILAGFFITNAIVAEIIGGKLVNFFGLFTQSIGIILWPVVFLLTDLMNEHFGKEGVRKLTFITVGLIIYIYLLHYVAMKIPAVPFSPVNDMVFNTVFGQSQ
ncbi:MAG: VUT family protein, partial [Planctomycetota bacterium]